ncbi:DBF4-type zinc finger-containing protein 2 isoform X1 [Scyliorhinus canicula]|uniref:DBF4-type zinc finger-containing protein 2 isoform X1 n=2 Tax=Scyliorhinus canicula TaxID=7830 RepID=UPI0018F6137C|nr:DBF4-type zinc finger-containing protein 2 isoform X1 [Scyliorhinus canicula]XP_038643103.1 DBF4-type zinc finger-containing protein 2 isoform X1 [Scyliorhinus canicula]XP_038643111.1 DBF4-type zinc finger-containing protein 2 isoform X1 [Scyliorhinus canicula]XP_038643119.1 DBF4-type zinc finger-containing protein 2 isoform X1 [Scyliorhinus canicula]XP_038643128.1 DBF4-type zinc finger-containing protein 2 isoform X1 [Scyliorhinus canicula]XP_038643138.1 DBF4-type zinc finger-containing pr
MNDSASGDGPYPEQPIPETLTRQSRRGYCGCCKELYTCLDQHLQTIRHRQFASETRNLGSAKSLMERFLQDVIQYHPSRYKDNRSTYMDLPSISAPLLPKKELADIHSYQDDKDTVETREELPSTDNESIRSAHLLVGRNTSYNRAKGSGASPMFIGAPPSHKDSIIKEPTFGEQLMDISSPTHKDLCRTAFLGVSEGVLSCNKMDKHGHRIALGLYKPAPRKGIKDHDKSMAVSPPRCEQHEHWSPTLAQMNFPNVSSGPAFRFSKLHNINSQGAIAGSSLPQLRDYTGPSSPRCTGGPSQAEENKPQTRNTVTCLSTLKETKIVDRIEDLVSETIETVIQKYCNRQAPQSQDSDSENSAAEVKGMPTYCQLEKKRKAVETGRKSSVPGIKRPPEGDHHPCTSSNGNEMICNKQAIKDTASCFKKMLSLTLSNDRKSGGHHQGTGEDGSSDGSICSLGSQLGHLRSTSSSEWDASVKVEKDCSRLASKDLDLLTDTQITLEDRDYKTQLSSVLHFQPDVCDKMEEENLIPSENGVKVENVEEKPQQPLEVEQKLRSLPYVPACFAGKTWSEIMAEDDLKVEALVKEFKEGRYLCYFDSESLANHGKKLRKKHRSDVKDVSKVTSKASVDTSLDVTVPEMLPHLQERNDEAEPSPAPCKPEVDKKPALRHCRLASRCQVVKVSHGTQTSEVSYPVVKTKSRRLQQEPENIWTGPEQEERADMKTRLCSLRLPRAYSKIMSPVQPRTVIYVLSSPDFTSAAQAVSRDGKRNSKASEDSASPTKYKYKKSPVRYYDPATNRIVKTPPSTFSSERLRRSSHHVRQLFRSLSPDINMGQLTDDRKCSTNKSWMKADVLKAGVKSGNGGSLQHPGNATTSMPWPAGGLKTKDWALGESPSSDCPSKSTGTASSSRQPSLSKSLMGSDGPPPPRRFSDQKSVILSPLRRNTPESPFGKLNVYVGPRSRRAPEKENPRAGSGEEVLSSLRGVSSQSDSGGLTTAVGPPPPRRPRLRSSFRAVPNKDGSSGAKVLRREAEHSNVAAREKATLRHSPRQGTRKRK